jgi:hypothetical protein
MTRLRYLSIFILLARLGNAGAADPGNPTHEVKVNLVSPIYGMGEVAYEHILGDHFGLGLSAIYVFGSDSDLEGLALGFLRYYPSLEKRGAGPFVEFHAGAVAAEEFRVSENRLPLDGDTEINPGLGLAVGVKYFPYDRFFWEAFAGLGRRINRNEPEGFFPRCGLSIGMRF